MNLNSTKRSFISTCKFVVSKAHGSSTGFHTTNHIDIDHIDHTYTIPKSLNPYSRNTTQKNEIQYKLNDTTCFKADMTIDDLINGDVFWGKGGSRGADSTNCAPATLTTHQT